MDLEEELSPPLTENSSSESEREEVEELRRMAMEPVKKKLLSKQLSMCETRRDMAWEKRRKQMMRHGFRRNESSSRSSSSSLELTDEDLDELKGSIELGFGFNEEEGQRLCGTLPALDLYFAVNRHLSDTKSRFSPSPASTPRATSSSVGSPSSPHTTNNPDVWKICNPGDDPQHVKTRLRHWAQVVACSVKQSY